jgi:putative N-acetylmannosamine-6-phosphate epimerase
MINHVIGTQQVGKNTKTVKKVHPMAHNGRNIPPNNVRITTVISHVSTVSENNVAGLLIDVNERPKNEHRRYALLISQLVRPQN